MINNQVPILGACSRLQHHITQQEIQEFMELRITHRRYEHLRNSINTRLETGSCVEPGRYSLRLNYREERRITKKSLRVTFGDEYVEDLSSAIIPSQSRYLEVIDNSQNFPI